MDFKNTEAPDKPKALPLEGVSELSSDITKNLTLDQQRAILAQMSGNLESTTLPVLTLDGEDTQPTDGTDFIAAFMSKKTGQSNDRASQSNTLDNTGSNTMLKGEVSETVIDNGDQQSKVVDSTSNQSAFKNLEQDGEEIGSGILDGTEQTVDGIVDGSIIIAKGVGQAVNDLGHFAVNLVVDPKKAADSVANMNKQIATTVTTGEKVIGAAASASASYIDEVVQTGNYAKPVQDLATVGANAYSHWKSLSTHDQAASLTRFIENIGVIAATADMAAPAEAAELGEGASESSQIVASMQVSAPSELADTSVTTGNIAAEAGNVKVLAGEEVENINAVIKPESSIKIAPTEAGAPGGIWEVINERISPDVVKQINNVSCVSACGEMLSNGAIDQATLINNLGAPVGLQHLADELGPEWTGVTIGNKEQVLDYLLNNGSWAAELRSPPASMYARIDMGHSVVVDGVNDAGDIMIRDPWEGTRYEMTRYNFLKHWTGTSVYKG